jgi:hypothetical protein
MTLTRTELSIYRLFLVAACLSVCVAVNLWVVS